MYMAHCTNVPTIGDRRPQLLSAKINIKYQLANSIEQTNYEQKLSERITIVFFLHIEFRIEHVPQKYKS